MPTMQQIPPTVQKLIKAQHFNTREVLANKRYYLIRGDVAGEPRMLKVESGNPRNSLQQRNHVLWTNSVQKTVPQDAPFHIAPVLEDGYIDGTWHWFMMPYVEGEPFATLGPEDRTHLGITDPEKVLPHIIALMHHIEHVPAKTIAGIDARYEATGKSKLSLLETAINWARNDTPYLAELLQIISANYKHLPTTNSHGDFTEVNLIINPQGEPVLIDAEISDAYNYAYYDAAEFYNRIFTRLCNPELARTFLQMYTDSLPSRSVRRFYNNFLCLSALRCIGNFMEIQALKESAGKQQRLEYARRYASEIVTYKIVSPTDKP